MHPVAALEVRTFESERGHEVLTSPTITYRSRRRAATSTTQTPGASLGIDIDISRPDISLHTPPSHSCASQQVEVSFHGVAHIESGLYSEGEDIIGGSPPRSPPLFLEHISLEPQSTLGTLALTATAPPASSLSDLARTLIVTSILDLSQGPSGNPTTAIITPTVSLGHTIYSTAVTTGIISEPVVSHPEFVSRKYSMTL